ncbi:MAG: hypothetical protein MUF48_21625 [Pirellulaceae bacterium]|jgi:hypothetical protein|nr:hypothetical protein [Pirellulaceae bacterium]
MTQPTTTPDSPFVDRREPTFVDRRSPETPAVPPGVERRQFANSHNELSPAAKELATAIDQYKLLHRRRFITFEEMLGVIQSLGYRKCDPETE